MARQPFGEGLNDTGIFYAWMGGCVFKGRCGGAGEPSPEQEGCFLQQGCFPLVKGSRSSPVLITEKGVTPAPAIAP